MAVKGETKMATGSKTAGEAMHNLSEKVTEQLGSMSETAQRLRGDWEQTERRALELVERYPLACVLGAVVGGYVLGRLASRSFT
jgi:hypothetical protein